MVLKRVTESRSSTSLAGTEAGLHNTKSRTIDEAQQRHDVGHDNQHNSTVGDKQLEAIGQQHDTNPLRYQSNRCQHNTIQDVP